MRKYITLIFAIAVLIFATGCNSESNTTPNTEPNELETPGDVGMSTTEETGEDAEEDVATETDSRESENFVETSILPLERQQGFDTPEDAVVAYLEGLRDLDFDRMIDAFAVEVIIEHYDLESSLNRIRLYDSTFAMLPNANEFATTLNIEMRRNRIITWIRTHYLALTHPELMMEDNLFRIHYRIAEDGAADFILSLTDALNAIEFQSLEVLGFLLPELSEIQMSQHQEEHIRQWTIEQGADQLVGRIVVFELDGHKYLLFADVVNYGDRWFLNSVGGLFASLARIYGDVFGFILMSPELMDEFFYELMENIVTEW